MREMKTIQLKSIANGEINLKEKSVEFDDKSSRMNKGIFKIYPFVVLFFGIYLIYSGSIAESEIQTFLRIISGILSVSIFVTFYHSGFFRTNTNEIELNEIKNVKMKNIFGEIMIDFKLKDNSIRRVYNIKHMTDWNSIKNHLTERKVECLN